MSHETTREECSRQQEQQSKGLKRKCASGVEACAARVEQAGEEPQERRLGGTLGTGFESQRNGESLGGSEQRSDKIQLTF